MKKKILAGLFILLMLCLTSLAVWIFCSQPGFPPGADQAIREALDSPAPELIGKDTGYVISSGVRIWYESMNPSGPPAGTILLFTGIAGDALSLPDRFFRAFPDSGFRLIRFDYRGTGNSDWMKGWSPERPYNLRDLAADALVILDTLKIERADLVGISMGGMVAQEFAINFPLRTRSLTSIMSSGYINDPALPRLSRQIGVHLFRMAIKYAVFRSDANAVRFFLSSRMLLMGASDGPVDAKTFAEHVLYDLRKRKGYNLKASLQHMAAATASGSRYPELALLNIPVLIIHGTDDPLIPIAHGRKCAQVIPGADTLWVSGMGHDLSARFIPPVTGRIIDFISSGE